ncbi:ABC transporter substrate-binding protein [Thiomicrospira microaerophila]|uniref:ABC transporter substrate-binding protein n=1 Tax=Thiomicrospira microaerophila TaxID=406020 RepID=UPI00200E7843|nr:ABC transporter substrate-binding protein [Thiomicrospira microaerophila]UQB42327.1 ABC transporter substrate-binding protein [Thiomicrospira microaerophila]
MHQPSGNLTLSRRQLIRFSALLPLAALATLSGCSQKETLNVAGHIWPGYEFIQLAQNFGWLNSKQISLIDTRSATETMNLFRQGKIDAAKLTLDEVLRLCVEGIELEVVLIFNISLGADVVISRPDITEPYQLEGKRVGFEKTALGAVMFNELLKTAQLSLEQVTPVNFTIDDHHQAWLRSDIDALITYEPVASQILQQQGGFRLFDSRKMPDMIFDVLVIRSDLPHYKGQLLKQLLQQHFKALYYFRTNPMDASHRMADRLKLQPEQVLQVFRGLLLADEALNYTYLSNQNQRLTEAVSRLLQIMKTADILDGECDTDKLFNPRYLSRNLL